MNHYRALACLLLLAGCDPRSESAAPTNDWTIVPAILPAPTGISPPATTLRAYAWKLNTKTGAVYFCAYEAAKVDCSAKEWNPLMDLSR